MVKRLSILFITSFFLMNSYAQNIDSIYVHLYTDSLKKGTFNYINIDGKRADGSYLPLDTTHLNLWASDGKWDGNSLWLEPNFNKRKVTIKAVLKSNPKVFRLFDIYIKQTPDPELPTEKEILQEMNRKNKSKKA